MLINCFLLMEIFYFIYFYSNKSQYKVMLLYCVIIYNHDKPILKSIYVFGITTHIYLFY